MCIICTKYCSWFEKVENLFTQLLESQKSLITKQVSCRIVFSSYFNISKDSSLTILIALFKPNSCWLVLFMTLDNLWRWMKCHSFISVGLILGSLRSDISCSLVFFGAIQPFSTLTLELIRHTSNPTDSTEVS